MPRLPNEAWTWKGNWKPEPTGETCGVPSPHSCGFLGGVNLLLKDWMLEMDSEPESSSELTYSGKPRTSGLRLSGLDACVLVVAIVATICSWSLTAGWSALLLFVVLHFFLFCNVFRIRRKPELLWATTFLVNCYLWIYLGSVSVTGISVSQVVITILILAYEIRLPYYHGVFARAINPRLDDYLAGRV